VSSAGSSSPTGTGRYAYSDRRTTRLLAGEAAERLATEPTRGITVPWRPVDSPRHIMGQS